MKWIERPPEIAYLLNPAFCCLILTSSIIEYNKINKKGMLFPLSFMVLPVILNRPMRESLPRTKKTPLADWIQQNTHLCGLFYDQTMAMKPFTQEALLFGFSYEWLDLNEEGILKAKIKQSKINSYIKDVGTEAEICIAKSKFLGRWYAYAGSAQTVMALWRIKP
jgi:hypothetical protein